MILTPRLLKIAQMVKFRTAADIGTDHAKLPVYLIENKICDYVIASDVADGPVLSCRKTVNESGFDKFIDIRKGDGLEAVSSGEADTVIIAGMGGDLMSYILKKDYETLRSAKEIILQPMTHIVQLRKFLHDNEYHVTDETLVQEKEKIYTIIKVNKGVNQYNDEFDYIVSPLLVENKDPLLKKHLKKLIKKYSVELNGMKNAASLNEESIKSISLIIEKLEKIYETAENY